MSVGESALRNLVSLAGGASFPSVKPGTRSRTPGFCRGEHSFGLVRVRPGNAFSGAIIFDLREIQESGKVSVTVTGEDGAGNRPSRIQGVVHMFRALAAIVFLASPLAAWAQESPQRPLSPPPRPPVPLTDADQERAREKQADQKPASQPSRENDKQKAGAAHGPHISSGNAAIDALANEAARRYGLDPCLVLSVISAESAYRTQAVSPKGASGLMQLMPATAFRFGVRNIFDPRENVMAGSSYLKWLLDRFGDVRLALAGYNAGEGAVEFYGRRIPPFLETQNYVRLIYSRYSVIHGGVPQQSRPEVEIAANQGGEKFPTYNQIIRATASGDDTLKQD